MAADVGTVLRYNKIDGQQYHKNIKLLKINETCSDTTNALITRDLLGQSYSQRSDIDKYCELDLDFQVVPSGWQKHLDLKSGKVYLQKHNTKIKRPLDEMENTDLDLRLTPSSSSRTYQSICTLDAVKSALERAKNNENTRKMFLPTVNGSLLHETYKMNVMQETSQIQQGMLSAAGCPNCLLYVMISEDKPKCPKCYSTVSLPVIKKSRIDLNLKI